MRLLHAETLEFREFYGSQMPPYAILSHRWEEDEVTYQDMQRGLLHVQNKLGFTKIQKCCEQAVADGLGYAWVDTCCIDKSSSAELTEAINSMYQWYLKSAVCYAYLSDVVESTAIGESSDDKGSLQVAQSSFNAEQFLASKWWTRGWTLQELIAPQTVRFFANHGHHRWVPLGERSSLLDLIANRTSIDRKVLEGSDIRNCSIANRMSWASERETTRVEDRAYSLLGILGVNMPLLYGEGERAFIRLQEELLKQSDDQTLFAWELGSHSTTSEFCGALATSPSQFRGCSQLLPLSDPGTPAPYSVTNKGLRIKLPIVRLTGSKSSAILQCTTAAQYPARITLPIVLATKHEGAHFARDYKHTGPLGYSHPGSLSQACTETIFIRQEPERSVQSLNEKLLQFQIHYDHGGDRPFENPYFEPELFSTPKVNDDFKTYHLPSNCHSGSLTFLFRPTGEYHLIILYRINDDDLSFSYDVVCAVPRGRELITRSRGSEPGIAGGHLPGFDAAKPLFQQCIYKARLDLSDLNGEKTTTFDTNKSIDDFQKEFASLEFQSSSLKLPLKRSLRAKTRRQSFHDQVTTILSIDLFSTKYKDY